MLGWKYKFQIIAWEHFSYLYTSKKRQLARDLSMKYADKIVVLSKADKALWMRAYQKSNKIKTIYNPITVKVEGKADLCSKQIDLFLSNLLTLLSSYLYTGM